jgi:hypothetical protein
VGNLVRAIPINKHCPKISVTGQKGDIYQFVLAGFYCCLRNKEAVKIYHHPQIRSSCLYYPHLFSKGHTK